MAKKESHQILEQKISAIFYKLCFFVSVVAILMMLAGFFSRGKFPPTKIGVFYISVLLVYVLHKEALRWVGERGAQARKRNGEYFVYGWVVIAAALYIINFLTKDYFYYSSGGQTLPALSEVTLTTIEVCGVFIVTRLLKIAAIHFKK